MRHNGPVSLTRRQAFIAAPVERIWELLSEAERHPLWWPRVVGVECEGLSEGCTFREIVQTPRGEEEMHMLVEDLEGCRSLAIRCVNTGTFVRFSLTEVRDGTFVDGQMGMDPTGIGPRVFDLFAGRRYFSAWMTETLEALDRAACAEAGTATGRP